MFNSKTSLYNSIKVDHRTVDKILLDSKTNTYLQRFTFSLTPMPDMSVDAILTLEDLQLLIQSVRQDITRNTDKMKPIYAENIKDPALSNTFVSLTAFANKVKGDRATIRSYLNGKSNKPYFRGI